MQLKIAIPVTLYLVVRSYRRKSLTPLGIVTAAATATIHALYPSSVPFTLLVVFFMLGTTATKVKHEIKATLTVSSTGASGGEGARTSVQVLANSGVASLLILIFLSRYGRYETICFGSGDRFRDSLMLGIIGNYAAVTADTLSSELGILSRAKPRLITAPWKKVAPGTNGGVTLAGLLAGMGGSFIIGTVSILLLSFCNISTHLFSLNAGAEQTWNLKAKALLVLAITIWGTLGSILDSLLGAFLQASVIDKRTGRVVEGAGGSKVLTTTTAARTPQKNTVTKEATKTQEMSSSRSIATGRDILDNNGVNLLMATIMGLGATMMGYQLL